MKKNSILVFFISVLGCSDNQAPPVNLTTLTFTFNHQWDDTVVTSNDFNQIQYTTENGDQLSIERLRYLISDVTFTSSQGENLNLDSFFLVDLTTDSVTFSTTTLIPEGVYNSVSFTFGFDNEDNYENYPPLNAASFNVPQMLGGGYHFMQLDGRFINSNDQEQGFSYHAIRAVDNPGENPTFPQDTFIIVNLGSITVTRSTTITVDCNLAEWFKSPNTWDLNQFNSELMSNSAAQIMMFQNGQNVFSLGSVSQ